MILDFELNEQDFLDFQLFTASQSKRINKQKRNNWILLTGGFGILSICFYSKDNIFLAVYFGIAAIMCGLWYPKYFVWRYKRHYKAFIKENYSYRFGERGHIEIDNQVIVSKNKTGESTLNVSEIEKIDETEKHFFVKIKGGFTLIIPKHTIQNPDEVRAQFEMLGFSVNKVSCEWK